MNFRILILNLTVAVLITFEVASQVNDSIALFNISNHSDCNSAIWISALKTIGPTTSPVGFGNILEFSNNPPKSLHFFENEHNTVWYKFKIDRTGILTFQITPLEKKDDYDFLLYKYVNGDFCQNIISKKLLPVRTNIARNDINVGSKTGLSLDAINEFKEAGPGSSFSKYLPVVKGEIYYLVVDNVYDGGSGHILEFDYYNTNMKKEIVGKVIDAELNKPLGSEVFLEDSRTGEIISKTTSDSLTGKYVLELPPGIEMKKDYVISVFSSKYFFEDNLVNISEIQYRTAEQNVTKISKLKAGKSFIIDNIIFFKDSPMFLPECEKTIKKLLRLMQENPQMEIQIEGHINGCYADPEIIKILSESRARAIYDYLVKRGIDPKRMTAIGYGCSRMIYPDPKNEEEEKANRRVEIKILKF